jgi:predicted secreted protein
MASGTSGFGTKLQRESGSPLAYLALAEVYDIGEFGPDPEDEVEVTNHDSPNRTREFAAGLSSPGTFEFRCNHIPGNATQAYIELDLAASTFNNWRILHPNATNYIQFSAKVVGWKLSPAMEDRYAFSVTLRVSGAFTSGT